MRTRVTPTHFHNVVELLYRRRPLVRMALGPTPRRFPLADASLQRFSYEVCPTGAHKDVIFNYAGAGDMDGFLACACCDVKAYVNLFFKIKARRLSTPLEAT